MIPGVLVDQEDADRVSCRRWCVSSAGYLVTDYRGSKVKLHHFLIGRPLFGMVVDHVNGDRLDNRKANLRMCTGGENARNTKLSRRNSSGHRGVYWNAQLKKWAAGITSGRHNKHLGCFDGIREAVAARHAAELKYFGEFAPHLCRKESVA